MEPGALLLAEGIGRGWIMRATITAVNEDGTIEVAGEGAEDERCVCDVLGLSRQERRGR